MGPKIENTLKPYEADWNALLSINEANVMYTTCVCSV